MFRNYLTIAIRHLLRHKGYSAINIVGLAIGMACCLLILVYVHHELSYDRFHDKADRIYRLIPEVTQRGAVARWTSTPAAFAPHLLQELPDAIGRAVRIDMVHGSSLFGAGPLVRYGTQRLIAEGFVFADSSLFEVFSFSLLKGNPHTALRDPLSLILTETSARVIFGAEDPLGKVVTIIIRGNPFDFAITGILRDVPSASHLQFKYVASFPSLTAMGQRGTWGGTLDEDVDNYSYYTYLLLSESASPAMLEKRFPEFVKKYLGEKEVQVGKKTRLVLQPITDIHLDATTRPDSFVTTGNRLSLAVFSVIALFILLVACTNFVNLSTARAATRAREVGMRKVIGAHRRQLIGQFLGESLFLAFLALLLALALVELALPVFGDLIGTPLLLDYGNNAALLLGCVGIGVFVGLVAGSYPAFYLSSFQPVSVLKGASPTASRGVSFRGAMVVGQFAVSIALVIGTGIVLKQFHFMTSQELGFDKERVLFTGVNNDILAHYDVLKQALLQNPHILRVSAAVGLPGRIRLGQTYFAKGEGRQDKTWQFPTVVADPDYLETLGLELVAGRNFSWEIPSDATEAYILNETAIRNLGWRSAEEAIQKTFRLNSGGVPAGRVVGVVRDFHAWSLHHKIEPLVLHMEPGEFRMVIVKIAPEDIAGTLESIKRKWDLISPEYPFEYHFLDADFERLYTADERLGKIVGSFSLLAIVIACLGLFGLASFTAEQRTKEIGIRKVLGASVTSIVLLLSKEFAKLVLVANVIAWPIAYYAMNRWLHDFAYRIEIGWGTFILGGVLAMVIALATVSLQAIKATVANPVDGLRYE